MYDNMTRPPPTTKTDGVDPMKVMRERFLKRGNRIPETMNGLVGEENPDWIDPATF